MTRLLVRDTQMWQGSKWLDLQSNLMFHTSRYSFYLLFMYRARKVRKNEIMLEVSIFTVIIYMRIDREKS